MVPPEVRNDADDSAADVRAYLDGGDWNVALERLRAVGGIAWQTSSR
ncbi:hypothetical protein ACFWNN_44400 [Lentzea sp. NPDC058450]